MGKGLSARFQNNCEIWIEIVWFVIVDCDPWCQVEKAFENLGTMISVFFFPNKVKLKRSQNHVWYVLNSD